MLTLKLKNFRCHKDAEFQIPASGLILFSGISGAGKSTVIKSIFYVLYGKIKKPCSFGATSCSVEMKYKDITIYRSTKPNVLKVNHGQKFEDDAAQSYINNWIGLTREEFEISGYIAQKNSQCILSLSPLEQIQTIQTLSFHQDELEGLKDRLKILIKESHNNLTKKDTQLSFSKKELNAVPELSKINEQITREDFDKHRELLETIPDEIKLLTEQKEVLTEQINMLKTIDSSIKQYLHEKKDIEKDLKEKRNIRENLRNKVEPVDQKRLHYLQTSVEYIETKLSYDTLLETETNEISQKKHELSQKIWDCETRNNNIKKLESLESLQKQHKDLNEEKKTIEKSIESTETLQCPECNTFLKLKEGVLIKGKATKIEKHDVSALRLRLKHINEKLNKIDGSIDQLKQIPEDYSLESLNNLEKSYRKDIEYQSELKSLNSGYSKQLKNLEKKLESSVAVTVTENIKSLKEELKQLESHDILYKQHTSELKRVETDIMTLVSKLEFNNKNLKRYETDKQEYENLERLEEKLGMLEEKLNVLFKLQKKHIEKKKTYDQWEKNIELQEQRKKWQDRVTEYETEYNILQSQHNGLLRIKERYRQAEILAVESTLNSINQHTQYYLDHFFIENPLHARLEIVDDKKMEIKTVINYKGYEYDSLTQLSGGEFDRCVLASVCGVNTMMNCPFLFLDESLSSLDAENNTDILGFLKEMSENKLIAVCSHEAIKGIFDGVVDVGV